MKKMLRPVLGFVGRTRAAFVALFLFAFLTVPTSAFADDLSAMADSTVAGINVAKSSISKIMLVLISLTIFVMIGFMIKRAAGGKKAA